MNSKGQVFFNLSEIAERWGTSVATVLRFHVQNNKLKTIRHGKAHLVTRNDLDDYEKRVRLDIQARIDSDMERLKRLHTPLPDGGPIKIKI